MTVTREARRLRWIDREPEPTSRWVDRLGREWWHERGVWLTDPFSYGEPWPGGTPFGEHLFPMTEILPLAPTGPQEDRTRARARLAGRHLAEARATSRILTDPEEVAQLRPGTVGLDAYGDPVRKFAAEDWREFGDTIDDAFEEPSLPLVVLYEPTD